MGRLNVRAHGIYRHGARFEIALRLRPEELGPTH